MPPMQPDCKAALKWITILDHVLNRVAMRSQNMKLPRLFLIAILLVAFVVGANGQEPPKAILVDEFSNPNCEVLWSRLDAFIQEMKSDSTSVAIIEISGKANDPKGNFYWDSMIRGYFTRTNFPPKRWNIHRTALADQRILRFWRMPPGAALSSIDVAEWTMVYPRGAKPFIFTNGESYAAEIDVCLHVDEIALLAKALEFNPGARVNVVLVVRSNREYLRRKQKITKDLVDDYSISRSRIKMFMKLSSKPNPLGIHHTTEYWLIP
jgi:hypothetical protein